MPDITYVVFIDEFGQIIHQCNNLEYNKIEGLINYIVEATDFPLVFILSLLQDLPDTYGSPIPMSTITLRPIDEEDVRRMAESLMNGYAAFTSEAFAWLYDYSGGHPFFLKLLLTKLFDQFDLTNPEQRFVTPDMLKQTLPVACRSTRADELLRDVYTTYMSEEERFVLLWLANQQTKFSMRTMQQCGTRISAATGQLLRRDFLKADANKDHYFRIRFLGDWLRSWPKFAAEMERLGVVDTLDPIPSVANGNSHTDNRSTPAIQIDRLSQQVYVRGHKIDPTLPHLDYIALVYLVERAGEVVSKDELANHIYPGDFYEGDDQRISAVVYRLRNALGDKKLIQTLRKRGFRIQDASFL